MIAVAMSNKIEADFFKVVMDGIEASAHLGPPVIDRQWHGLSVFLIFKSKSDIGEARKERLPFIRQFVVEGLRSMGYLESESRRPVVEWATEEELRAAPRGDLSL